MSDKFTTGDRLLATEASQMWESEQHVGFTAGEAIDGSTTPQAVYQKISDGKIYKAVATANAEALFRFIGFTKDNVAGDASIDVYTNGTVDGFTGLTVGDELFITDSAGSISTTPGTKLYKVARAISATEILIEKGAKVVFEALSAFTGSGAGNDDLTITTGFAPKFIKIYFNMNGYVGGNGIRYFKGIASLRGTSLVNVFPLIGVSPGIIVSSSTYTYTETNCLSTSVNTSWVAGASGSNNGAILTVSVSSISNTGFVLRRAITLDVSGDAANCGMSGYYEVIG